MSEPFQLPQPITVSSPTLAVSGKKGFSSFPGTPSHVVNSTLDYFPLPEASSSAETAPSNSTVFVFPDMIAFDRVKSKCHHSFDAIPIHTIQIHGFESYLVEQWIYERSQKNQIVIYTGNPKDCVYAYKLEIVNDQSLWPAYFRAYIAELGNSRHSFPTICDHGTVFVTNVSQLDASLTLVPVPGGNIKKIYKCYVLNHNLKHLGCGSRSATVICSPAKPVEDKFRAAFHIHHSVPFEYAVRELVCIVQTFLYYYGLLSPQFCDGLCCKKTEAALAKWWKLVGDIKPCTALLKQRPPNCTSTVSYMSVVGFSLFVRTLLALGGSNFMAPKDPLDVQGFRVSVLLFQRAQKMHRSKEKEGYLDHETISRLFSWVQTVKGNQNFAKDLTKVKNIVKNTVLDLTSVRAIQALAGLPTTSSSSSSPNSPAPVSRDGSEMANCQDYEQIGVLCAGKRLQYLFFGKGKPLNLDHDSLAAKYERASVFVGNLTSASHKTGNSTLIVPGGPYLPLDTEPDNGKSHHGRSSRAKILKYAWNSDEMGFPPEAPYEPSFAGGKGDPDAPKSSSSAVSSSEDYSFGESRPPTCPSASQLEKQHALSCRACLFERRLKRRNSIPFVGRVANVFVTELQATNLAEGGAGGVLYGGDSKKATATRKRSQSFSEVEEGLNTGGTDCFDASTMSFGETMITEEWLAQQYIMLLRLFKLGMLKTSTDIHDQTEAFRVSFYRGTRLDRVLALYQNLKSDNSKTAAKYRELRQKLRTSYKISARLKYEVHLLLQKTKEIEANLKSLEDFKIDNLKQRISKCQFCLHMQKAAPNPVDLLKKKTPENVLSWKTLVRRPYLIFYVVFCYIWCLWTMYFSKRRVSPAGGQPDAFKALFHKVYYGVDRPKLVKSE